MAVAAVLVLLYTGSAATAGGSGTGDAGARPGGLVGWLGRLVGGPPAVRPADLSAPCLAGTVLTVKGTCTLTVARGNGTRRMRLHTDDALSVTSRPPGQHQDATSHIDAGKDVDVTVDADGGDVGLVCPSPGATCTARLP